MDATPVNPKDLSASKQRAAAASLAASALLALAKLAAGLLSGSLALLSDSGHALLDTIGTSLTLFAVRAADKPADAEHQYGHAKIEAVAALVETGLLFLLALAVLYEAAERVLTGVASPIGRTPVVFAVLVLAIGVDFARWRTLRKVAHETGSHALAADALHFSSDCLSSALVLAGILATDLGVKQGDALAAAAVASFIFFAGVRLGMRTIDALLDAAPKGATERVRDLVESVPGVLKVDTLRLRPSGAQVIGEVEVAVPRTMAIETAEDIRAEVARAISEAMPNARLIVSANPRALETETVREKIHLIAARRGLSVHHVTVQDLRERKSASLDLELDSNMSYGDAHEIASALEAEIRGEIGDVEVETHIEPLDLTEKSGFDAEPQVKKSIEIALTKDAAAGGVLCDIHGVRVRVIPEGLVVNYHCRVTPRLSVQSVHEAVDRLDHAIRAEFNTVVRIVGHAEPLR